jgi:hypothetical protein
MADDNIVRSYRSIGPSRRASEPVAARDVPRDVPKGEAPRTDPLAELARLIGQSDPFADMPTSRNRSQVNLSPPRPEPAPASDWRVTAAALAREAMRNPPAEEARFEDPDPQMHRINSAIAAIDSYRAETDTQFAEPQHHVAPEEEPYAENHYTDEHNTDAHYADGHYADGHHAESQGAQGHYDEQLHFGANESAYPAEEAPAEPPGHEEGNYFFDGELTADQRFYDDPPKARRNNGLVTAAVLIGCAMLGTVGAYAYRSYYSGARSTDAPIIAADPTPNKMVPAAAGPDLAAVQERAPDKGAGERIGPRQEEPVTLANPSPRVVYQAPFAPAPGAKSPTPSASASAAPTAGTNGGQEPRKVRTVAIKPDASDPGTHPLITSSTSPQATLPAAPPPAHAAPAAKPAPRNGGPLSLEPRAPGSDAPAAPPAPAPRLASVPSTAAGGYFAQLSSQTSEAEAQASFRSLQAKYPRELGDREVSVKRADVPGKGIRYRAMVGPFASSGDASQFCDRLKSAGGDCITQKY